MINLDFQIDHDVLRLEKSDYPNYDSGALFICFMMPVSLKINDIDVFQERDGSPARIALLDLARTGYANIKYLEDREENRYDAMEDAGSYWFKREGDKVIIRTDINDYKVIADYHELLHAFNIFANKVRAFFIREFPVILDDERWGGWIKGDDEA